MKKFTLIAAAGVLALGAQAQYQVNPSTSVVKAQNPSTVDYIILSEGGIAELTNAGAKMTYIRPSAEEGRNLWYWAGLAPGDESYPRVDMEEGGYASLTVTGDAGWSGGGFAIDGPKSETVGTGVNLSHFDDNTRFHLAYFTPSGNAPASIALIILDDGKNGSDPAKVALGTAFDDNGVIFPTIGAKATDEWQGIDISLGDLKKTWPSFNLANKDAWGGNILSFLAGNVAGTTFAFDACYFYNAGEAGINDLVADSNVAFIVTDKTINVAGANGIKLYNIAGQLVKSTEGTTLGLDNLAKGIYVANAAGQSRKVVVK